MKTKTFALLVTLPVFPLLASACATTSGGSKGSSAPFQGVDAVTKRRTEIANAGQGAMDCMKAKPGEPTAKGGIFAVTADAAGKLKAETIKFDGPDGAKQCILDSATKATITPLAGPSVGTLWEFVAPGEKSEPGKAPEDLATKMQPLSETMQTQVIQCGQRFLGVDFGATVDVAYFLYNNGQAYVPTVIASDAKDGSFEACVQEVVANTKFPIVNVDKPFGATAHFKIGQYGDTQHRKD
jgi:hypothetical protein